MRKTTKIDNVVDDVVCLSQYIAINRGKMRKEESDTVPLLLMMTAMLLPFVFYFYPQVTEYPFFLLTVMVFTAYFFVISPLKVYSDRQKKNAVKEPRASVKTENVNHTHKKQSSSYGSYEGDGRATAASHSVTEQKQVASDGFVSACEYGSYDDDKEYKFKLDARKHKGYYTYVNEFYNTIINNREEFHSLASGLYRRQFVFPDSKLHALKNKDRVVRLYAFDEACEMYMKKHYPHVVVDDNESINVALYGKNINFGS